ncbi:MAG: HAMP domain-containing histidine kinase [Lachnospiraceae bacterium]|nr:HAMP domain-containing histidine kinase [Lachnospiraceae bacterium]
MVYFFLIYICLILVGIILWLRIKCAALRKSAEEINEGVRFVLTEDTNALVTISSGDPSMRELATNLNVQLQEIKQLRRQYESGDRELKEAVTNISHDLRTPLTAIWGYVDLLENQELSPEAARYVARIKSRADEMRELTEELFRYSVIASTPEVSATEVNMNEVLEEAILSNEALLREAGIEPEVSLPPAPVLRKLDRQALSRIFENLVSNAAKYSDGDLSISLQEDATVTFANTAAELTPVETEKLFDRFYTVNTARNSTGLGLSIAKLLTERMHGTIGAVYEEGRLVVTVRF